MANRATTTPTATTFSVDAAVQERYRQAAIERQEDLCCPVDYEGQYLDVIPQEIIERDYGCGNPSRHVRNGEVVLDLGCGVGKICYIVAQVVGPRGRVIGIDCNDEMLALARQHRHTVGDALGYHNVEFRKGKIEDLRLNLELLENYLAEHPVASSSEWLQLEQHAEHLRSSSPLVQDESVDVVVSNCVLNLVNRQSRVRLFSEMHRVLKRGGRAVISDIVADQDVPDHLRNNPQLWSGCISGAFREDQFLEAFEEAGFYGISILERQVSPWAVNEGIEFRSVTVQAFKGKEGPCLERKQAVIYNGPWKAVIDDDGHKLVRGQRTAVCDKTFTIYTRAPYAEQMTPIPPHEPIPLEKAAEFDCRQSSIRSPQETKARKGETPALTVMPVGDCCGEGSTSCC